MSKFMKTTLMGIMAVAATGCASIPANANDIKRNGEAKFFHSSIEVPAGAETLYLSGHVPSAVYPDAPARSLESYGNTEEQTTTTLEGIQKTIEKAGWSMSDIIMVRAYLVADPNQGKMDFRGFNTGYAKFFGTEEQPEKPVRAVMEVAGLALPGWLVEIEVRAARMPVE